MRKTGDMPGHGYSIPMYLGAGGIATAAHYATMIALVELFAALPMVATASGFGVGAAVKYWLNYVMVFRSDQEHAVAVPRFAVTLAILFILNMAAFWCYQQLLDAYPGLAPPRLHYIIAQVLTTGTMIPPGYALSRLWVYRSA
jgi:putative flippase GtrA